MRLTPAQLRYLKSPFWLIIASLAVMLFVMTARYFSFRPDINFLLAKKPLIHHPIWRPVFYIHIAGAMVALLIGPFQFLKISRTKFRKFHRRMGKIYVGAILFVGAPGGFYMAFFANGGPIGELGFVVMALLWLHMTLNAYRFVRAGEYIEHSRWMVRSYAMTFAAVSLRLYVPLTSAYFNMDHNLVIVTSAWVSWIFNLLVAEAIIATDPKFRLRKTSRIAHETTSKFAT
jgi:uncharacterized membrane protein